MLPNYARFHKFAKKEVTRIKHDKHVYSYSVDRSSFECFS